MLPQYLKIFNLVLIAYYLYFSITFEVKYLNNCNISAVQNDSDAVNTELHAGSRQSLPHKSLKHLLISCCMQVQAQFRKGSLGVWLYKVGYRTAYGPLGNHASINKCTDSPCSPNLIRPGKLLVIALLWCVGSSTS